MDDDPAKVGRSVNGIPVFASTSVARLVLEHRLSAQDPLEPGAGDWERDAAELVLSERPVSLAEIAGLLVS